MERRDFLKQSSLASSLFFVPSFVKAFENVAIETLGFKKLVIIQLSGGNDGLNTIVPYTNDIYYKSRPSLALPKQTLLKVTDEIGFNSNMAPLKNLFDKGYLTIINNVGYPNPDRSHFRATDIWHTASDSNEYLSTGWLGRYIEKYGKMPYSGIELDDSLSLIMKGEFINGIATKNPSVLFRNIQTPYFEKVLHHQSDVHLSEHNLGYLYKTMVEAKSSAKYIYETTKTFQSTFDYPNNPFGKQLKTTAEFINSNLDTKVYYASMGGFDTHAVQENKQNKLLQTYSEAIAMFVQDLEKNNTFKDTLILTFSEFGRRVKENAAKGTDHGAANNVFIIGKNLKSPGFYNDAPNLTNLDSNGDIKYTIDFRTIYASILENWLNANHSTILNKSFDTLSFI
ncbi:DUF1501 domain-containing protein [Cellulophaga tyrosinoxydans]|jgi:uncharacterized protein (DUF1501 family)|uniref:Uncharacterized conserved protein, DUF1501 family n=1 Tax=Cellulophaga tyrosinoxydans TaxID=504486 RepID=A0A1W2C4J6_9FLAO|nr:DUF1501 domain-containing protein [Cellulophaga tyrosinoxydans]SMC80073.1 Uncharacterized conserved protein, DUF1501 family [Cellulophaga tyrosinoxydans]